MPNQDTNTPTSKQVSEQTKIPDTGIIIDEDLFNSVLSETISEIEKNTLSADRAQVEDERSSSILPRIPIVQDGIGAIAGGIAQAGFETKDFIFGEPENSEKSNFRKSIERDSRIRQADSAAFSFVEGISQFATGIAGVGKIIKPIQVLQKGGKVAAAAREIGKGAVAGAVVIDPHEARLSDLVEQFPSLQNPVTEFLASDPSDSAAEGRLKNALEGIGVDLALVGVLGASLKVIQLARRGDEAGAIKAAEKVSKASPEQAAEAPPVARDPDVDAAAAVEGRPAQSPTHEVPESKETVTAVETPAKAIPLEQRIASRAKTELTDETLATIIKSTETDTLALRKYGSREDAIAAGHVFAKGVNLPWQKLRGTEDVEALVERVSESLKPQLDVKKGGSVLSDPRVSEMVRQRAVAFNEDPEIIAGLISRAGDDATQTVANMEAGFLVSNRIFQDAENLALRIQNGNLEEFSGDVVAAQNALKDRLIAGSDLLASSRSIVAASGRTLRRMRSEFRIKPEELESIRSLDGDALVELVAKSGGDLSKLTRASNPSFLRRALDETAFSLTNSLLWLYPTHLVNMSTNAFMLAARPTEKLFGSLALNAQGKGAAASAVRKQALKEYTYSAISLSEGFEAAVEAFRRGDSAIAPHNTEFFEQGTQIQPGELPWRPVKNVGDLVHNSLVSVNYRTVVGFPTRALGAMDELVKTMRYRAVVQARSAVEANERGLLGDDFKKFVQDELIQSFDEAGRGIDPAALREAQISTFTTELEGTLPRAIQDFRNNVPGTQLILPFVKTPLNVLGQAVKMTPGLNLLQKEFKQMISGQLGAEAQAQAIGQFTLGALFMGTAAHLALDGRLTGGGPSDLKLKKQLIDTGWKPYSIVWENSDGKKQYFPIGRFDPVGLPFGMVADLVDMMVIYPGTTNVGTGITALGTALFNNLSDRTFLQNLAQATRAISDPEKNLSKFAGNLVGNAIPLSSLQRGLNPDPHLRDARGLVDNMLKNTPGYSETLPPQRDSFGEPLTRRIGLTSTDSTDFVEAEHNRIVLETGQGIHPPLATRNGVDLRDFHTDTGTPAFDRLQELSAKPSAKGRSLKEALAHLIKSSRYRKLVDGEAAIPGTKLNALRKLVSKYREVAYKRLLKENPELREKLMEKRLDVRSRLRGDVGTQQTPVEKLMDILNIPSDQ